MDSLGERLHNRTSQLEELSGRLKEFEEGRQAAERRLEAARHQIEVQEALGPQVLYSCSGVISFFSIILRLLYFVFSYYSFRRAVQRAWNDCEVSKTVSDP